MTSGSQHGNASSLPYEEIIAGKYAVERGLGTGGMGRVVAARHLQLGRRVAVKLLHADVARDADSVERLLREARSAASIKSEHVVDIIDVGALETGSPYVVMEYLEGEDLEARFRRMGALPVDEAVDYLLQASAAVAAAHAVGIVHRDIKPANLFLTQDAHGEPLIKALDFGISKATRADTANEQRLTMEGESIGSPIYMSPEQVRGDDVDTRTDIWGLGVALYELLAANVPFKASKIGPLYAKILGETPTPLLSYRADVPPGLEAVIHRCLEKDRDRRYATVAELAVALVPFATRHLRPAVDDLIRPRGTARTRGRLPTPEVAEVLTTVMAPSHSFAVTSHQRPPRVALIAVGVALALGALVLAIVLSLRHPGEPASPQPIAVSAPTPSGSAPLIATGSAATTAGTDGTGAPTSGPVASVSAVASALAPPVKVGPRTKALPIMKSR